MSDFISQRPGKTTAVFKYWLQACVTTKIIQNNITKEDAKLRFTIQPPTSHYSRHGISVLRIGCGVFSLLQNWYDFSEKINISRYSIHKLFDKITVQFPGEQPTEFWLESKLWPFLRQQCTFISPHMLKAQIQLALHQYERSTKQLLTVNNVQQFIKSPGSCPSDMSWEVFRGLGNLACEPEFQRLVAFQTS